MKKYSLFIFFMCVCHIAFCDVTLPRLCEASLPKILNKEFISEDDVNQLLKSGNWGQSSTVRKYWTVYSDRANNETYNSASTRSRHYTTLEFNQPLRIAKIQGNFALVYQEEEFSASNLKINKGKSFGWVPMDHLLLWPSCPTNKIGIYNKALPVVNIDEYTKNKEHTGKVYKNPTTKATPLPLQTGIDLYFIMKYDKKSQLYLLAKERTMNGYSDQVLYGWVSKNSFVKWNSRICLEPNWDHEFVHSLIEKGENSIPIYSDVNMSKLADFAHLGKYDDIPASINYRMPPDKMRHILLDSDDSLNSYKIISFYMPIGGGALVAFEGYTPQKDKTSGYDYWKPVIYVSDAELRSMMKNLQPVMAAAAESSTDRKPYLNAMKALTRIMIPDIAEAQMESKSVTEIMAMVAELPVTPEALQGRTLKLLADDQAVEDSEFDELINNFKNKYAKLDRIKDYGYKYSITRNDTKWYWIPVEDLP